MTVGLPPYTFVGAGTPTGSGGSTVLNVTPHADTLAGDLVVVVTSHGWCQARIDKGDGWYLLDHIMESGVNDHLGYAIYACIAPRNGSSGYAGIEVNTSKDYILVNASFRAVAPGRWDLHNAFGSHDPYFIAGSTTTGNAPHMPNVGGEGIDLVGRAALNGSSARTLAALSGFTQRTYNNDTFTWYFAALDERPIYGREPCPTISSNYSASMTQHCGVRAFVPIVGRMTTPPQRYGGNRRGF